MRTSKTFDANLELKDSGNVYASAAATVDGAAKIIDLGAGYVEGDVVIDVTAIEIASNDELYQIGVQVSSSATFASAIEEVATLELGALEVTHGDIDSAIGRYILPFRNEMQGTVYRYMRLYTTVSGSIANSAGGITYSAYAAKK